MDTVEQRLQVLERELRRSRRVTRVLGFGMAAAAVICLAGAQRDVPDGPQSQTPSPSSAPTGPDVRGAAGGQRLRTVEADQFVLLDRLGRARARMLVGEDGPAISMFDEEGGKRLELSQTRTAAGLRLYDSNQSPVVSLQLPHDFDPCLEMRGPRGKSLTKAEGVFVQDAASQGRLYLALINGNFPVLGISRSDQHGPPSIEMTANEGGSGLKLHDRDGFPMLSLSAADDGRTSLALRHPDHERSLEISAGSKDSDGPVIAALAPAKEDGTGGLLPRVKIGLDKECQPFIRVNDSDGRPAFAAP